MRHRRTRTRQIPRAEWPPTLRLLIRAAEAECPRGHAEALIELTALALRKVPARGIFDPTASGEHELFVAIESVADAHFDFSQARAAWRAALDAANLSLEHRDDLERAVLQVQSISDTAYFYAGLAFGLASMSIYSVNR
jgi:hypothetical protein